MEKSEYKFKFVDRILDPVHGFIDLTLVEQKIINLPIFRRLQGIKQLSMTNWVFPGAEHTRFIHSLGVMYIADQMAMHLDCFNDGERQLLRLAGLLHDIGHYPLSHVTESVYRSHLKLYDGSLNAHNATIEKKVNEIYICSPETKQEIKKLPEYMESRYSDRMHHETMGTNVIKFDSEIIDIIKNECDFIDIDDICDIIVGHVDRKPELSVFVQLIHSELDADGIDYIMRDASFSGTSYGSFELGMLLRNLTICEDNGVKIVGIRPKGITIVDQYLINKFFSYKQIIFNKHVAILDFMVEKITHALINLSHSKYPSPKEMMKWVESHRNKVDYLIFTDIFFWSQVTDSHLLENMDYVDEKYIRVLFDMLLHYAEPELKDEFFISSNDRKMAMNAIKMSHVLSERNEDKDILLFHTRKFTKEIPLYEYQKRLKNRWGKNHVDNELIQQLYTKRLQEGVAVIDSPKAKPRLLVDDSRSVMSSLWENKTYIIRRYRCE